MAMRHTRATLTADGHEPFEHITRGGTDDAESARFCTEVWLMGHPERRRAKNVRVTVEPVEA